MDLENKFTRLLLLSSIIRISPNHRDYIYLKKMGFNIPDLVLQGFFSLNDPLKAAVVLPRKIYLVAGSKKTIYKCTSDNSWTFPLLQVDHFKADVIFTVIIF